MPVLSPADWQAYMIVLIFMLCLPICIVCAFYVWQIAHRWPPAGALVGLGTGAALFGWQYGRVTIQLWPGAQQSSVLRPALLLFSVLLLGFIVAFTIHTKKIDDYMVLQNQFIANVSHELRTPLNVIMGFSSPELADTQHFPTIHRAAERMAFLVDNVLGVARLEEGGALQKTAVDLADIAAEGVARMHLLAQRSGISLQANLKIAVVCGSEPALELLLNNLLHNAIKFNQPGGGVEINTYATDDGGVLQVRDTGIGIAAKDFPRLFKRFEQLDGSDRRSFTGVGIGLYFVDLLVQAHGGHIRVESVVGEGSLFEVWLPGASHG